MKKEDMKKLTGGEKTGLNPGYWETFKLFLCCFVVFTLSVKSQVPINGFCKYNYFKVPSGFNFLAGTNLIEHPKNKLLLYSPDKKELGIQVPNNSEDSLMFKKVLFKYEISNLYSFTGKSKKILHVFTSRKRRILGTFELSNPETPNIISTIGFDTYPENLDIADVDMKGTYEFLVSGSGFDGISVIYQQGNTFTESKVTGGEGYNYAGFIDVNNDGFPDIVAQNLYENKLQFFINDGTGSFKLTKSINLKKPVNSLKFSDLNNDGFGDIVLSDDISITIFYGDFASSYKKKVTFHTAFSPDEILISDFNNDGLNDISYLNKSQGLLVLLFSKKNNEFTEVVYCHLENLNDSAIIKVNGRKGIAGINNSGSLVTISNLEIKDFAGNFDLVPSINPLSLCNFSNPKTRYNDFGFIDAFDNQLKLFINGEDGVPVNYYFVPLAEKHKNILVDETIKDQKYFYCYTTGSRLFEIVKIDFQKKVTDRKPMYSPGDIQDVFVDRKNKDLAYIYLAYTKSGQSYVGRFEYRTLSITFREYPAYDRNVLDARITNGEVPVLFYWKTTLDSIMLMKVEILPGPDKYKKLTGFSNQQNTSLKSFITQESGNVGSNSFSVFYYNKENRVIISDGGRKNFSFITDELNYYNKNITGSKSDILFKYNSGYLTAYLPGEKSFQRLDYRERDPKLNISKLLDAENAGDYFVEQIDEKKLRIVFTNNSKGCISSDRVINQ
jgi:FG-GAP-like repeat